MEFEWVFAEFDWVSAACNEVFADFFLVFFLCLFWLVDRVGCQFHGAKLRKGPSKTEQKSRNERKNKERATISASPIGGSHRCAPPFLNQSGGTGWQGTFPWSRLSRILEQLSIRQTQRNWNVAIFFRCVRVSRVSVSSHTVFVKKNGRFEPSFVFCSIEKRRRNSETSTVKVMSQIKNGSGSFRVVFFKAASKVVSTRAKRQ